MLVFCGSVLCRISGTDYAKKFCFSVICLSDISFFLHVRCVVFTFTIMVFLVLINEIPLAIGAVVM